MKPTLISSLISLVIGFAGGWVIKSASADLITVAKVTPPSLERRPPIAPPQREAPEQPIFPSGPESRQNTTTMNNSAEETVIPESAKRADQAKWIRLVEVLGLSTDQSKALAATIQETKITPLEGESPDFAFERKGEQLQKSILAILDPSQQESFRKFQQRALENKVEVLTQKSLAEGIGNLDLTAAQREQALGLIRKDTEADLSAISPATRLALSGSILPIGNEKFSDEGILLLRKLNSGGNQATMEDLAAINRAKIKESLNRYEGILTPGQLESYRAMLGESLETLNLISPPKE